jgi:5-formyltetrahydrofolate cyclo-ligase
MVKKEIHTKPLIQVLLKSGRTVFVPKVTKEQQLSTHKIHTLLDLKAGAYGIEEPVTFENHCSDFDCMILPMLAADLNGNRVGYGKGFYDKLLNSVNGYKIGVVYDACVFDEIESEPHDIKMDLIVTEKRIIDVQTGNITVL